MTGPEVADAACICVLEASMYTQSRDRIDRCHQCAYLTCAASMEDGFEVPSAAPAPEPSVSGGAGSRASKSSASTAGSKGRAKLCGFPSCDEDSKCGRRHCGHHHRHLDNARNQVIRVKGEAAGKAFVEKCKNIEFANGQIEHMMKLSVGLPMFARAPMIDFVKWEQEFGVLVETTNASQLRPFEEGQWIIKQVTKFGRDKEEMKEAWKQKLAGPWRRDHLGYNGCIRLWLPALEFEQKANTQFVKGAAKEESKIKKNPKDFEIDAFRRHATEADLTHGHSFFNGGSGITEESPEDYGAEREEKAVTDDAASSKDGVSPVKRKAAETLDASEDEVESRAAGPKSKKPRKAGNLASARATLFDTLSKQMQAKCATILAKIQEAEKVQSEESSARTTTPLLPHPLPYHAQTSLQHLCYAAPRKPSEQMSPASTSSCPNKQPKRHCTACV